MMIQWDSLILGMAFGAVSMALVILWPRKQVEMWDRRK
jgi:hypothetical protein